MDFSIIYNIVPPILASAITWKLARPKTKAETRKTHAEAKGMEIENVDAVINIWREAANNLSFQVDDLKKEVIIFRQENILLKDEMVIFRKENKQLKDEIIILQKQNSELKADLIKLKDMLKKTSL